MRATPSALAAAPPPPEGDAPGVWLPVDLLCANALVPTPSNNRIVVRHARPNVDAHRIFAVFEQWTEVGFCMAHLIYFSLVSVTQPMDVAWAGELPID